MILVCTATGTEAAACRRGIGEAGAEGIEVLTTGVGLRRAAEALGNRLARASPSSSAAPTLIVSSGFAGALTPGIEPLAWVTAESLSYLIDGRAAPVVLAAGLIRRAGSALPCHFISADHVITGAVRDLGGPAVADMESAALAEVASAADIPFLVLRLVTDTPSRPLAPLGCALSAALAARGVLRRAAFGARAALDAARSPARAAAFLRETTTWRDHLRAGWREQADRGVPCSPVG